MFRWHRPLVKRLVPNHHRPSLVVVGGVPDLCRRCVLCVMKPYNAVKNSVLQSTKKEYKI